jgi:hypothetical protein
MTSLRHDVASTHQKFPQGYFLRSSRNYAYFQIKLFRYFNIYTKSTKKMLSCGKFPAYNSPSVERDLFRTMKLHAIRSVSALSIAVILAACGGGQADQPTQTAAAVIVSGQSGASAQVASSTMPQPDCAAEGCKGLRIIDGNAEAYRYDAMRRAQLEAATGNSNS